jgi:hypothetical protein
MQRMRALSEEECYLRCYGQRGTDESVRVLDPAPPQGSTGPSVFAERIRLQFEAALEAREPEAA